MSRSWKHASTWIPKPTVHAPINANFEELLDENKATPTMVETMSGGPEETNGAEEAESDVNNHDDNPHADNNSTRCPQIPPSKPNAARSAKPGAHTLQERLSCSAIEHKGTEP
ncbi:hypothetical protein DPMN_191657 [Dreissena polymorpha]|uniref:Uncharacterized protein n=1 Tax=Dreissena polymorpha TaxID=45954 RepID=A0A9D3Y0L9_DREPO|nr:hypothetical protein DPMN_191657 [Dreissena polymorpha]